MWLFVCVYVCSLPTWWDTEGQPLGLSCIDVWVLAQYHNPHLCVATYTAVWQQQHCITHSARTLLQGMLAAALSLIT